MGRPKTAKLTYGSITASPMGYRTDDPTKREVVVPAPSTDGGQKLARKPMREGKPVKVETPDGLVEYVFVRYMGMTRVIDADGRPHRVKVWRPNKKQAEEAARAAADALIEELARGDAEAQRLAEEQKRAAALGDVTTTVADLVDQYLASPKFAKLATRTRYNYELSAAYIREHAVGPLLPRQVDVAVIRGFLADMSAAHGAGGAKHARAVLRASLSLAIGVPALHVPVNPVVGAEESIPANQVRPRQIDTSRAPTDQEVAALLSGLTRDPRARAQYPGTARRRSSNGNTGEVVNGLDLADLTAVMFATGARIGEVAGLRWSDYDPQRRTLSISGTVVSVPGQGTFRQERTKTKGSTRIVPLAPWAAAALARRARRFGVDMTSAPETPIFPSPQHHDRPQGYDRYRDQANLARAVRDLFTKHGVDWARGHSARKWRVTSLAERGIPTHKIADLVGHSEVATTWGYLGRGRQTDADVIAAL